MNEIDKIPTIVCDNIINILKRAIDQEVERFGGRVYSDCPIQMGYRNCVQIVYSSDRLTLFFDDLPFEPYRSIPTPTILVDISHEYAEKYILPILKERIEQLFMDDSVGIVFDYRLEYTIEIAFADVCFTGELINEHKRTDLMGRMTSLIDNVINSDDYIFDSICEQHLFSQHLLAPKLLNLPPKSIIEILDNSHQRVNEPMEGDWWVSLLYNLDRWAKKQFLPLYFDEKPCGGTVEYKVKAGVNVWVVDEEILELYIYYGICQIRHGNAEYGLRNGRQILELAKKLGSEKAEEYLKKGIGMSAEKDIYYKDANVECKANDILAQITITIKNELEESYAKAIEFIVNLLDKQFPHSYHIKLNSKTVKRFLPIEDIVLSDTHRFFASALKHKPLHDQIGEYAYIAMEKLGWYEDMPSGEYTCISGTYAVFGLGLRDHRYFPLVQHYFETVTGSFLTAHKNFITLFIERHGVTEESLPVILTAIFAEQGDGVYRNVAPLMDNATNINLIIDHMAVMDRDDKDLVIKAIWGSAEKLILRMKKANIPPNTYMEILEIEQTEK